MRRELAGMNYLQVREWRTAQRDAITFAYTHGRISSEVYVTLLTWAEEEYMAWLEAFASGLIKGGE